MHLVSIIIPCYNHGHYLDDALDSVLDQTYTCWEAIVVNDGSTDDTAAVVESYAAADARIRCIYQDNAGLSAARNAGIRFARGEYLAFLDADDAWEPGFLKACISVLSPRPELSGVYTRNLHVDELGAPFPRIGGQALGASETRERLLRGGFFPPCSVVARLLAVVEAGLFDEQLDGQGTEDWDLWLRITARGDLVGLPQLLARYRLVSGSMSTDVERMHRNRLAVLAKRFGLPQDEEASWPDEQRAAYAWAYRSAANQYISQGQPDQGWDMLARAAAYWPTILAEPETHYELACWDQPRSYRGQAASLDLERNAALMLGELDRLFAEGGPKLAGVRAAAYSQALLALAMLADQAGRWGLARRHLVLALRHDPRLAMQAGILRRLAKLCAGRRVASMVRTCRLWRSDHVEEDAIMAALDGNEEAA